MNRRNFLRFLGIGAAAAVVAPEMVLDPERELWVPGAKSIFDLGAKPPLVLASSPFRIVLPDGTVFSFDGIVRSIAAEAPVDGLLQTRLSIQPTGALNIESSPPKEVRGAGRIPLHASIAAHASFVGGAPVELQDITLPRLERTMHSLPLEPGEEFERYVPGLIRSSPVEMTISGTFEPDVLRTLLNHQPEPAEKPRRRR